MSVVANPQDDLRLRRIINEPARKIGTATLEKMAQIAAREGTWLLDVCRRADQFPELGRTSAPLLKVLSTVSAAGRRRRTRCRWMNLPQR